MGEGAGESSRVELMSAEQFTASGLVMGVKATRSTTPGGSTRVRYSHASEARDRLSSGILMVRSTCDRSKALHSDSSAWQRRLQPIWTAGAFLDALPSGIERKTGWLMAEQAGLDHALIDRRLYLSETWAGDAARERRRVCRPRLPLQPSLPSRSISSPRRSTLVHHAPLSWPTRSTARTRSRGRCWSRAECGQNRVLVGLDAMRLVIPPKPSAAHHPVRVHAPATA